MNVAIIGAGACGLFLAIQLDKLGINYKIYNKGKPARKILASGNGKCNIGNLNPTLNDYFNNVFAYDIVNSYKNKYFDLLSDLKIYVKEISEGRIYPYSESSASVVDIFLDNIHKPIIDLEIKSINKKNNKYYLNENEGPFDIIVIATGSMASYRKDLYLAKPFNNLELDYKEMKPALVGFIVNEKIKEISGARAKAKVSLINDDEVIYSETGEIIFKDNGISGICVMNLSSYYQRSSKKNSKIVIDFVPNLEFDSYKSVLTPKLYEYVINNKINPHNFVLNIKNTYDFEFAQVANGGISLDEVGNNLMLKKYKNIFVGGEVLDVDARCGGFNLMFAFTSALKIFEGIKYEISNK